MDQRPSSSLFSDSPRLKPLALAALWLLIAYWSYHLLRPSAGSTPWIFVDNLNLMVHEAGHWLFMPFGLFMQILGGSVNQCLLPAIFLGYFIYRRDWVGTTFGLFWLGNNLINVSYYIGDARAMVLPLLGGDTSGHDWHNLLTMTNSLELDSLLATLVRVIGSLCLFASLLWLMALTVIAALNTTTPIAKAKT